MAKLTVVHMGRAGSGPEFHSNFGSGRVGSLVGQVGSVQENWANYGLMCSFLSYDVS